MAGIFIVSIPQKNQEEMLNKNKSNKFVSEKEIYENASKLIHELKGNRRFGSRSLEPYVEENPISKSKSIESLYSVTSTNLYKSKSDNSLNMDGVDGRCMKPPWEDKPATKPKTNPQNKLKPTGAGKTENLGDNHSNTPLETILSETIERLGIHNPSWSATKNNTHWQVMFTVESNRCEQLVQVLTAFGIGSRHQSSVSVMPCVLHYAAKDEVTNENETKFEPTIYSDPVWSFISSTTSRTNLRQVIQNVREDATLTPHWLCLMLAAAFLATLGLMDNSSVTIVASMLISPLMGPIAAVTLGTSVRDRSLQLMGLMHTMLGLFLCLATGFITGLVICILDERYGFVGEWPTSEMVSRCELRSLWVGILVAVPSGACVALAIFGQNTASLVGVVISASILPAAANSGLLWAMALDRLLSSNEDLVWSVLNPGALATLGTVSFCLTLINTLAVFIAGVAVYKIKQMCPFEQKLPWWRRHSKLMKLSTDVQTSEQSSISGLDNEQYTEVPEATAVNKLPGPAAPGLIQSDTVTYRRTGLHRLRAQNIEAYCLRKTQFEEKYTPYASQKSEPVLNNVGEQPDKLVIPINEDVKNDGSQNSFSFYNWAYHDHQEDEQRPTLEPSLNLTVTPNNCGITLNTKSFEV